MPQGTNLYIIQIIQLKNIFLFIPKPFLRQPSPSWKKAYFNKIVEGGCSHKAYFKKYW